MKKCGYSFSGKDPDGIEFNFSRPTKGYPRYHIYLKIDKDDLIINLHFDQKKPIYKGVPAHSAEYGDKLVKEEAERIKELIL